MVLPTYKKRGLRASALSFINKALSDRTQCDQGKLACLIGENSVSDQAQKCVVEGLLDYQGIKVARAVQRVARPKMNIPIQLSLV